MSLLSVRSLMLMHLYLQIVHSLFFTYPLMTLVVMIHHIILTRMTLYQMLLKLDRELLMSLSLLMSSSKHWGYS